LYIDLMMLSQQELFIICMIQPSFILQKLKVF